MFLRIINCHVYKFAASTFSSFSFSNPNHLKITRGQMNQSNGHLSHLFKDKAQQQAVDWVVAVAEVGNSVTEKERKNFSLMATTAATVKVYGPPMSTAVSRVLACLLEKEVEYQLITVDMAKGQHKSPDYLKIQPFGQVPAFQDDDIALFESRAICRYVSEKYANKGNKGLYGMDLLVKASIEQWLEAEGQSFNPPSSTLVFQLAFAPRMKLKQDPALIKQSEAKLAKVLDVYEQRLGESRFLAGEEFTLADLSHLPNAQYLVNGTQCGELFTSRKNVKRWWDEISGRASWKKIVEMQNAPPPNKA